MRQVNFYCAKCQKPMVTENRHGTCVECRSVKCAHDSCPKLITVNLPESERTAAHYCREHKYLGKTVQRKRKVRTYVLE